jgi:diacylglycerol O-acyltransferase / wax synthase
MGKAIPPLDLLFYLLETHDNPKHVAGLQIFSLPDDAGPNYLLELVEKLRAVAPIEPFNFRPLLNRPGIPQWQAVDNVEMEYHLRHSALPSPGTTEQLLQVIQRLHAGMLDRQRPGWICQVIEGLEGNRFAIYSKIHHAYIDGKSGTRRMYGSLSANPLSRDVIPMWSFQPGLDEPVAKQRKTTHRPPGLAATVLRQAKALTEVNSQLLKVGMELAKLSEDSGHIPFRAPRTHINRPVSSDLRSIGVTSMPLDTLKLVSKAAGCTINDVVLTLTDAALHDYLIKHGENPDKPLVAMCPMSLRTEGDQTANTQVATLLIELGKQQDDLKQRLQNIRASSEASKAQAKSMSKEALIDYVLVFGAALELLQRTGLETRVPQSYNVLVSNVPGPGENDLYLAGAKMEAAYPISTLTPGNNLNLTVLSHGNRLDFGLLGALGSLPDIHYLVERLEVQFVALCEAYGVSPASDQGRDKTRTRKPPAKKKTAVKAKAGTSAAKGRKPRSKPATTKSAAAKGRKTTLKKAPLRKARPKNAP